MRCRFTILSCTISAFAATFAAACQRGAPETSPSVSSIDVANRLPTGRVLDPVGTVTEVGSMPLATTLSPDGRQILVLLNGYREQGVQVVDRASGTLLQTLVQPAAFLGLSFSPDGKTLYASGGNQDVIYRYSWADGRATLADSLVLAAKAPRSSGTRYPGGLAPSADGRFLYVAENLADSLAVIDLGTGRVVQRFATERWPYGVVVGKNGTVYVSAWGGSTVSTFLSAAGSGLSAGPRIRVGRHPSALAINAEGSRLFVASASSDRIAIVDTKQRRVINDIIDTPPGGPGEGSTPNALALSSDGTRLYVAEADNNAIALIDLTAASSGVTAATGDDRVAGRVPTQWYPTSVLVRGDSLIALTGKGRGTAANPRGPMPLSRARGETGFDDRQYTLGQTTGSLVTSLTARARGADLDALSARVAKANHWGETRIDAKYPPFEHVIYIIKENRTYDQYFGDLAQADGDASLVYFGRPISPNHHALAERFGIFDRFFVNAEVSPDGHNWSTAAYTTDYLQKTVPSNYSSPSRGRTYDWEGTNRGRVPVDDDDVSEPANGYLWNLAQKAGITFRNYGEFVIPANADPDDPLPAGYRGNKPFLRAHTNPQYPGFDLNILDQRRADVWLADLAKFSAKGEMPALQLMRLPNDHTSGAKAGAPTPHAQVADNDLALGRIVEGLSRSPFWKNTIVFVLEDDAQNGSDHVDSHRSPLLVISAWNKAGVYHRFANTTDVIATIERILKLGSMSQFDHFGRPLTDIFASAPDLSPYRVLMPSVPLDQKNPPATRESRESRESARLDLRIEDAADEEAFNRILWRVMKGGATPYPGARRMSTLEYARAR
jgi:DNA-binding beta-propeller fold protein YncE